MLTDPRKVQFIILEANYKVNVFLGDRVPVEEVSILQFIIPIHLYITSRFQSFLFLFCKNFGFFVLLLLFFL